MSPYRQPPRRDELELPESLPDGDLILPFGVIWAASLVRLIAAVVGHETAAAETTLAALVLVLAPLMARAPLSRLLSQRRRARGPAPGAAGADERWRGLP